MEKIRLGKTELMATRSGFGALPIQRISFDDAALLLRRAYEAGINFFDTAAAYSDSEEKIGYALSDVRENIIIASKTPAFDYDGVWRHLETSLRRMKTDYVDIYQFHNPDNPMRADSDGYRAMLEAKQQGLVRHIGITAHKLTNAEWILQSGLYETLQYPLSALSDERELALIDKAKEMDIGVIAMKALCGGLLTSAAPSMAVLRRYDNVVPIWGFQRPEELEEVISLEQDPPQLTGETLARIEKDRAELMGDFCRGCGYCLPCTVGLPLNNMARMPQLLRRSPLAGWMTPEWEAAFDRVDDCTECGACVSRCPYHLDIPRKIRAAQADHREFMKRWKER